MRDGIACGRREAAAGKLALEWLCPDDDDALVRDASDKPRVRGLTAVGDRRPRQ